MRSECQQKHMANINQPVTSEKHKLPNKVLLEKFSILAEGNDEQRLNATKIIIEHLTDRQTGIDQARKLVTFSKLWHLQQVSLKYNAVLNVVIVF